MSNTGVIPPLDFAPDNPFVVNTPTAFDLPQTNEYCANLTVEQLCILIAGVQALDGTNLNAATLLSDTETYVGSGFAQDLQAPGLIYTLLAVMASLPTAAQGLVFTGNYGGEAPPFTPLSFAAVATDSVTLRQWQWLALGGWK